MVVFTFNCVRDSNGRRRRVVIEEQADPATGAPRLVVKHRDGESSEDEMQRIYADALAMWMHPSSRRRIPNCRGGRVTFFRREVPGSGHAERALRALRGRMVRFSAAEKDWGT